MKSPKLKLADTSDPFKPVQDDPQIREVRHRLDGLRDQIEGLKKRKRELEAGTEKSAREAKITAVQNGAIAAELGPSIDKSEIAVVAEYLDTVEQAMERVSREEQALLRQAVRRGLESAKPEAAELAALGKAAIIAIGKVQEAANDFQSKLRTARLGDWPVGDKGFGPLGFGRVGQPDCSESLIAAWLISAYHAGVIDLSGVPTHWIESWGVLKDLRTAKPGSVEDGRNRTMLGRMVNEASQPTGRRLAADRAARRAGIRRA